ncbi:MAG: hypothetical protein B6D35_14130 [Candidatus Brocadia sp. UTAMX2]|jgi:hypothetical protein|nr:MAG: hypothetical protein B6D35_14130 [Candidatus Brocadia sp. UTAMX2]
MKKKNRDLSEQFDREVFPTELIEIAARRKEVFSPADFRSERGDLINELPKMDEVIRIRKTLHNLETKLQREEEGKGSLVKKVYRNFQKCRKNLSEKEKKNPLLFIRQVCKNFWERETNAEYEHCKNIYEDKKKELMKEAKPTTSYGLVGLALSGGGIRSATFNLGVLQVLAEHGALKHVDYLSTVSGGGYIGSCLSSVLNNPETGPGEKEFPFRHEKGKPEPLAFKHLRNYGNYIAPNGIIDWLKIPALFVRGALINLLLLLPYVMAAVIVTVLLYGNTLNEVEQQSHYVITENAREKLKSEGLPPEVMAQLEGRVFKQKQEIRDVLTGIDGDVNWWSFVGKQINKRNFSLDWKTFYNQYRLTVVSGIGYLCYVFLFLFIQIFFFQKIKSRTGYDKTFSIGLLLVFICALLELTVTVLSYYLALGMEWIRTVIAAVISFIPVIFAGKVAENISKVRGKITLWFLGMLGPFILFLLYLMLCKCLLNGYISLAMLFATAAGVFGITRIITDINRTSFHNYYRDQLSPAYLFQTAGKESNIRPNDEQKLSDLNRRGTKAPYHLINVALNLHGSKDVNLRDRNADFFILSKHFCGGLKTGFCKTTDMEKADCHLDPGTAMAISGAAAAPNMGTTTIKPLVFIMALLNIRLGYWIPNPRKLRKDGYRFLKYNSRSPFTGVGPDYLVRELFGRITEDKKYVNISDGGHIENLGIYELLRRRCKYIIACDAEADPDMTFGGLAKLIRYARIDLSIDIDINLDALRRGKDENEFTNKHCASGKIHYGDGETGYLLYIKSSLTGDENEYIREYHSKNKDFPHESTADQFFDEAQFEAYRALGYHIADKLGGWEAFGSDRMQLSDKARLPEIEKGQGDEQRVQDLRSRDVFNEWYKILETSLLPR